MSPLPLPFSHWILEKLEPRLSGWSLAVCRKKGRKGSYSLKGEIILKTLSYYKVNEDNTCFVVIVFLLTIIKTIWCAITLVIKLQIAVHLLHH